MTNKYNVFKMMKIVVQNVFLIFFFSLFKKKITTVTKYCKNRLGYQDLLRQIQIS